MYGEEDERQSAARVLVNTNAETFTNSRSGHNHKLKTDAMQSTAQR